MTHYHETKALLEHSAFYYIICTNMQGNYSYVNSHYQQRFSYINEQFVGQPYYITMHENDRKVCAEVAAKCFAHPQQTFPATIRKHDGKGGYIITQWEYKALWNENNEPDGIFCLGYDITEHVQDRFALTDAKTELELKTAALRDIAFAQSHIIRRPLANILGLAQILQKMEVDQNLQNMLDMLLQSCNQLDDAIAAIVDKTAH